jgi:hypothetical protein
LLAALLAACTALYSNRTEAVGLHQIAIVPGADLVGTIDIKELSKAAIFNAVPGQKSHALSRSVAARSARIKLATGLTSQDITSVLFSCQTPTIKFNAPTPRQKVSAMHAMLAVELAKPVSIAQIRQAIKLEYGSEELAGVDNITINGYPALTIKAPSQKNPDIFAAMTPNNRVLLVALNTGSLSSALKRAKAGKAVREPQQLARLRKSMPPRSQVKIAAIVPDQVRNMINIQSRIMMQQAKQKPQMAGSAGVVKLFANIQTISVGILIKDDILLTVAGDLASRAAANQAGSLIKTMLIPIMQAAMDKQSKSHSQLNLAKQIKIRSSSNDLFMQIRIPQNQLFPQNKR